MNNWLVTIPQTVPWAVYEKELAAVADGSSTMFYRVHYTPKEMAVGDRMYIVHKGHVRGWMAITEAKYRGGFTCETTGIHWPAGFYIGRSGEFHKVAPFRYKGFQGVRKYTPPPV